MDAVDPLDQLSPRSRAVPRAVKVRIGVGAASVLLVGAFATAVLVGMFAPRGETARVPAVSVTAGRAGASAVTPAAVLYVHVLGAVNRPGLYALAAGSRVVDAVGAAGGLTQDADRGGVNLARPLADGEQLVVPHVGEAPAPAAATGSTGGGVSGGKVNLNTATDEQLQTLPRVGPAMAAKIIAWRTQNGRFTSVDDLMNVDGVGQKTFDGLKGLVTV